MIYNGRSHRTSRRSSPRPLLPSQRGPPLDRLVGRNEDVYVTDGAPGFQAIHLKQEDAHKFVLHLVHLCKPHGYALELYAGREAFGKLSVYEVENQPAARVAEGGGGWADRGRYVVLECVTLDELAALA